MIYYSWLYFINNIINNLFKQGFGLKIMKSINKLFAELKKEDLLDDRSEYDVEDLQSTYGLNKKQAKLLFLKIQKWKKSCLKSSKKRRIVVK